MLKRDSFRIWLREELAQGRIPGVLACVNYLNLNHAGARGSGRSGPSLTSRWTKIRREEYEAAGLKQVGMNGRWYRP